MNIFMIAHMLTAILAGLKLASVITLSWLLVFMPSLLALLLAVMLVFVLVLIGLSFTAKPRYGSIRY